MKKLLLLLTVVIFFAGCPGKGHLREHRQADPDDGDRYYEKGAYNKAFDIYTRANEGTVDKDPSLLYKLADTAWKLKRYRTAIFHYERFRELSTDSKKKDTAIVRILLCYIRLNQPGIAEREYKNLTAGSGEDLNPQMEFIGGQIALMQDKQQKALAHFLRYLESGDSEYEGQALFKTAYIYSEKLDRAQEAAYYFNRIDRSALDSDDLERYNSLYRKFAFKVIDQEKGLPGNAVSSLTFDGDDLWIGTWLSGISRYNINLDNIRIFKAVKNNFIANTIRDIKLQGDFVWVATFEGLTRYNKKTGKYDDFSRIFWDTQELNESNPRIKSISIGRDKIYIASLGKGLRVFDIASQTWDIRTRKTGFFNNFLTCLKIYDDKLYIGSLRAGVAVLDTHSGKYKYINKKSGLSDVNIRDIYVDEEYIIIGTKSKGIFFYNHRYKLVKSFNQADSILKSDYINAIDRKGNLVFAGSMGGGLVIINVRDFTLKTVTVLDGLASDNITRVKYRDNFIWLGTIDRGLIRFLVPD